jgi:hypothetical protein
MLWMVNRADERSDPQRCGRTCRRLSCWA